LSKEAGRDGARRGAVRWRGIEEVRADHNTCDSRTPLALLKKMPAFPARRVSMNGNLLELHVP
jgi:hypothetical protein